MVTVIVMTPMHPALTKEPGSANTRPTPSWGVRRRDVILLPLIFLMTIVVLLSSARLQHG